MAELPAESSGNDCYLVSYFFVEFDIHTIGRLIKEAGDKTDNTQYKYILLRMEEATRDRRQDKCFMETSKEDLGCVFHILRHFFCPHFA